MNTHCKYCGVEVPVGDGFDPNEHGCPNCGRWFPLSPEDTIEFVAEAPGADWPVEKPSSIGRYRVLEEIGRSGLSRVYQAYDTGQDRVVALKLSAFTSDQDYTRFNREREIVSKLRHPNIVPVLDYGFDDEYEFVVTEYVGGESLRSWQAKENLLPIEIAELCGKIAHGLAHAHSRNIVHRDLKPANVIVDSSGRPRIVDFGIALDMLAKDEAATGRIVGTPAYMSPEQASGGMVDERTDIYALGVLMYELLVGERPYEIASRRDMARVIAETPPAPIQGGGKIPDELVSLCLRCLEKKPEDRFQSTPELIEAIEAFVASDRRNISQLAAELRRVRLKNTELQREASFRARMFIASQSEHQLYQALVEELPLGVIRKDRDGRFIYANETFCDSIGRTAEDLEHRTSSDIFSADLAEQHDEIEAEVIATGQAIENIEQYEVGDEIRTFEVKRSPIRNFDAEIVGIQAILWDVSAHTRAENALRAAKEAAETASQAKSNFLANISHEIRTPMQAVIGLTDVMLDRHQAAENSKMLKLVRQSADGLLVVINDILDFSRIEAGRFQLNRVPFDLPRLFQETAMLFEHAAEEKNLTFVCDISKDLPQRCLGDPTRVRQILLNLLGNALKFTDAGEIRLSVDDGEEFRRQRGVEPAMESDQVALHFVVSDTGKGISPEAISDIFEPFHQEDGSRTRRHGGTGLGLTICNELVSLIGGDIWVASRVGSGSEFHVLLDLQRSTEEAGESESSVDVAASLAPQAKLRILLVEDQEINQQFALMALQEAGHSVHIVNNGKQALDVVEHEQFDIVLMDIQMPEMDGHTAARRIRLRETASGGRVPIIAITAHATAEDRRRCLESGMDGYLSKPISYHALLRELARVTSAMRPSDITDESSGVGETFDREKLEQRVGGDREFLKHAFEMFRVDRVRLQDEIEQSITARDGEQFARTSHQLLGLVRNFDSLAAAESLIALKSQPSADQDWTRIEAAWLDALAKISILERDLAEFIDSAPN